MVQELAGCMSQSQLAKRVGVDPKEIRRWIKGDARPQAERAEALRRQCVECCINPRQFEGLKPIYGFERTFERNSEDGPEWLPQEPTYDLPKIGFKLWELTPDSPIGIPACVLTANSQWIIPFSKRGFDIFTYKTVRSSALVPHPFPNLAYVPDITIPQPLGSFPKSVRAAYDSPGGALGTLTLANSFGMPSEPPEVWQADMERTQQLLGSNQVLLASVVGTAHDQGELIDDFVRVAKLAAEVKPAAIELNFSCPNVYGKEGSIYHDPELAERICKRISAQLRDTKLVVKIGYLTRAELQSLFDRIYRHIDGIAGINTLSTAILSAGQRDEPLFPCKDDKRKKGGVSGIAIKEHAIDTVKRARELADRKKPELMIFGMGGISSIAHVKEFIEAGANCVQICTAAMFNPLLAIEIRRQWGGKSTLSGCRALTDPAVRFTDENIAVAYERAFQVAVNHSWPAEDVIESVQTHWVRPYKERLSTMQQSVAAPIKARSEAPTAKEIEMWFIKTRDERLLRAKGV